MRTIINLDFTKTFVVQSHSYGKTQLISSVFDGVFLLDCYCMGVTIII